MMASIVGLFCLVCGIGLFVAVLTPLLVKVSIRMDDWLDRTL